MRAHPRRTYSVTRMPEPEINFMSFMLPFSLSKLAKRWEVLYCIRQLKDETKDREWWGDGLRNWSVRVNFWSFDLIFPSLFFSQLIP